MYISGAIADYDRFRAGLYLRRDALSLGRKLILALSMAAITGILAQVRLPLAWTPVPVTGQVLAVLLSGVFLGGRLGACSQLFYIALGAAGVPWFTGFSSGLAVLGGPTGGYLLGFVPAAFMAGSLINGSPSRRTFPALFTVLALTVILCIYLPGTIHLAFWTRSATGHIPGLKELLYAAVIPFLPGEAAKIACSALSARLLGPPPAG